MIEICSLHALLMKYIPLLILLITFQSYGQDDCIFDQSTQTDDFIKNIDEFQNYTWDNSKKEATIFLNNGDTLVAQRGGCIHFGISGTLIQKDSKIESIDQLELFNTGLWIAQRLFNQKDFKELEEKFENKDYTIERDDDQLFYMYFDHDYFSEYYLRAEQFDGRIKVEIGYYFN